MDKLTSEQRSRNMSAVKNKDTKIEITLRKELYKRGYRYRKNVTTLPGKPDIVIKKYKIAIFCDSEFFHGKDWNKLHEQLKRSNNSEFWINKISKNIEHDREIDKKLFAMGWTVLRFWGKEILKNPSQCVDCIEEQIFNIKIGES